MLAIFAAISAICATFLSLRYEARVVLPKTETEARDLMSLTIIFVLGLGLLCIVAAAVAPLEYHGWFGLDRLGGFAALGVVAGVAAAIVNVFSAWLNRHAQYRTMSAIRVAQALLGSSCSLVAGLMALQNGLIYAQLAATMLGVLGTGYFALKTWSAPVSMGRLVHVAIAHSRAPLYLLPNSLLDVVSAQLPFFLIASWFTTEDTGHYRMSYSLLTMPGALFGTAVGQVFYRRFAEIWPDQENAKRLLVQTWGYLALVGLVPFILVMGFGEQVFQVCLGVSWVESGKIARVLAPMVYSSLVFSPTSTALIVLGMERKSLCFGVAAMVYRPLGLLLGCIWGSLYLGLGVVVVAEIIAHLWFNRMLLQRICSGP